MRSNLARVSGILPRLGAGVWVFGGVLLAACFSPGGTDATASSATIGSTSTGADTSGPATTGEPTSGSSTTGTSTTTGETTTTTSDDETTTTTSGTESLTSLVTTDLTLTGLTLTTELTEATGLTATTLTTLDTSSGTTVEPGPGCADGVVDAGEQCDDGNLSKGDGCDDACQFEWRYIFVTSDLYTGIGINNLSGADTKCQTLAGANTKLAGRSFVAWLSNDSVDAKTRIGTSDVEYRLPDATTKVADDTDDLLDGSLDAPIGLVESGLPAPGTQGVWTGTLYTGLAATNLCNGWSGVGMTGMRGFADKIDLTWTQDEDAGCLTSARLYCVEKAP